MCARARGGGGQERARSGPGSRPGFAGRRRREAALSLLASGSQACGSVGPAARAEGAQRGSRSAAASLSRGRGPARPPPPGATEPPWGPAPSRCICQGLLLFSKCISRPEPPPTPPLPVGLSLRGAAGGGRVPHAQFQPLTRRSFETLGLLEWLDFPWN